MHNHKPQLQESKVLSEGFNYKDLEGLIKPEMHIDEFAAQMGDDDDVVVLSFVIRSEQAAEDLVNWFEKGYDFVLDADRSPGEIEPNRFLVYVELRRRTSTPYKIQQLLDDLSTLTEYEASDWSMVYETQKRDWAIETYNALVPINASEYRARKELDLNEMRVKAGLETKQVFERDAAIRALQNSAGI